MIASQNANLRANSIETCVWIFKPSAKALPYHPKDSTSCLHHPISLRAGSIISFAFSIVLFVLP